MICALCPENSSAEVFETPLCDRHYDEAKRDFLLWLKEGQEFGL